jgi:hypothetical protein
MTISMDTTKALTLDEIAQLLNTTAPFAFAATNQAEAYAWVN